MKSSAPFFAGVGVILAAAASRVSSSSAFSTPVFQERTTHRRTAPSQTEGVSIELPNFDELFYRIQQVSPLAKQVLEGGADGGFANIEKNPPDMNWKVLESNKRRTVHQIDKIDNFQNLNCPIVRFRSSLKGPCVGEKFAGFVMNLDERKKWDHSIEDVDEIYPIYDMAHANLAMGMGRYGDCVRMGVGYCQTKANLVATAREQLILCGIQKFECGSTVIWGTEMEEWHNHLLPDGKRLTRAKSHLFTTTLIPTGPDTFDVEYVLQLEIGGKIPTWATTPIVMETVKNMFSHAKGIFEGKDGEIEQFIREKEEADAEFAERSLLMTP